MVDAVAFVPHNKLDISENGLSEVDYICLSPHKMMGGSESTGVLIGKKSSYDSKKPPSFPGGGTVIAVTGIE